MVIFLYRLLSFCLSPWLALWLYGRAFKGKEDKIRLKERLGHPSVKRGEKPLAWFHAASVGESLTALTLIQAMKERYPRFDILLTTGTLSSFKVLEKMLPEKVIHQFAPLDTPQITQRFLSYWRPSVVFWLESEFWPNQLLRLKGLGIPAFLINACISRRSFKRWSILRQSFKHLLEAFQAIYAQSKEQEGRFRQAGHTRVKCYGHLKYSSKPLAVDPRLKDHLTTLVKAKNLIVYASTHYPEEEIAFEVHQRLVEEGVEVMSLIAPRHPSRLRSIVEQGHRRHLRIQWTSQPSFYQAPCDVVIIDSLGKLGTLFDLATVVFVGGSMAPQGGHNIIEPAHFKTVILHGPHMFNFAEVREEFQNHQAAIEVKNADELYQRLREFFQSPEAFTSYKEHSYALAQSHRSIIIHLLADLDKELEDLAKHVA